MLWLKSFPKLAKKIVTAANKRASTLEIEFADASSAHAQLVDFAAQSETGAIKTRADFQNSEKRLEKVRHELRLVGDKLI